MNVHASSIILYILQFCFKSDQQIFGHNVNLQIEYYGRHSRWIRITFKYMTQVSLFLLPLS